MGKKKSVVLLAVFFIYLVVSINVAFAVITKQPSVVQSSEEINITWTTRDPEPSVVSYGHFSIDQSASTPGDAVDHVVTLPLLTPGWDIAYTIQGYPQSQYHFTVQDFTPPQITKVNLTKVLSQSAVFSVSVNELSKVTVFYGATLDYLDKKVESSQNVMSANIDLSSLAFETEYYYIVSACDSSNNCVNSTSGSFMTLQEDSTPPPLELFYPNVTSGSKITVTASGLNIRGVSEQYSKIKVYVNSDPVGVANYNAFASKDGTFEFSLIRLQKDSNRVVVVAEDASGNTEQRDFEVAVDKNPPNVEVLQFPTVINNGGTTSNILFNQANSSQVNGVLRFKTDEEVMFVMNFISDTESNLTSLDFGDGFVVTDENILKYYVDGKSVKARGLAGEFTVNYDFPEGANRVQLFFIDKSGNFISMGKTVYKDTEGPSLTTNLAELDPSFSQEITITGHVSEQADIVVFVNGDSTSSGISTSLFDNLHRIIEGDVGQDQYKTVTDENGNFKINVRLTNLPISDAIFDVNESDPTTYTDLSTRTSLGTSYDNHIIVYAIDRGGNVQPSGPSEVRFQKCGQGNYWNVKVDPKSVSPAAIPVQLLYNKMAQASFTFDIKWQGPSDKYYPIISNKPSVRVNRDLSVYDKKELDEDFVGSGITINSNSDFTKNFAMLRLNGYRGNKSTLDDRSRSLTMVKIPLIITVESKYKDLQGEEHALPVQTVCEEVIIPIDVRLPPDKIPERLLNNSVTFLTKAINVIDGVLKPLKQVTIVVFVASLAANVVYYFMKMMEVNSCDYSSGNVLTTLKNIVTSEKTGNRAVIKMWLLGYKNSEVAVEQVKKDCVSNKQDINLGSASDEDRRSYCDSCVPAVSSTLSSLKYVKMLGNRIYCPNVPSVDAYINGIRPTSRTDTTSKTQVTDTTSTTSTVDIKVKRTYSNCLNQDGSSLVQFNNLESLTEMKNFQPSDSTSLSQTAKCLNEYQFNWEDGGLLFDELEASACLQARQNNIPLEGCGTEDFLSSIRDINICSASNSGNQTVTVISTSDGVVAGQKYYLVENPSENSGKGLGLANYRETLTRDSKSKALITQDSDVSISEMLFEDVNVNGKCSCDVPQKNNAYAPCKVVPSDIWSKYCTKSENIILKPTSGIMSSVQAVCLPAMISYLNMWKNIFNAIRQCFLTILTTKEFKSGTCQAVLEIYVCDLIYSAIRCFGSRYGATGSVSTEGTEGIGNFMKAVAQGSSEATDEIAGMYGNSLMFQNMFSDQKLIHAACVYAFTGTWDLNLESMLTSGSGGIPIESQVFLYPHDMRFMSSDPTRQGRTNWIYHFGVGIAAGADLEYHVYLECSADSSCTKENGFDNGCDCLNSRSGQPKVMEITSNVGDGNLKSGAMLDKEVYLTRELQPFRYDTVRVTYKYKNNEGTDTVKELKKKISLIGGAPPADCKLDLPSGEFRCAFTVDKDGYAAFSTWPQVVFPDTTKQFYAVGEDFNIVYDLEKKSPRYDANDDMTDQYQLPKAICYSLKNQNGVAIEPAGSQFACKLIEKDGLTTNKEIPIPMRNSANFRLSADDFRATGSNTIYEIRANNLDSHFSLDVSKMPTKRSGHFRIDFDPNTKEIRECAYGTNDRCPEKTVGTFVTKYNGDFVSLPYTGITIKLDTLPSDFVTGHVEIAQSTQSVVNQNNLCPPGVVNFTLEYKLVGTKLLAGQAIETEWTKDTTTFDESKIINYLGTQQTKRITIPVSCIGQGGSVDIVPVDKLPPCALTINDGDESNPRFIKQLLAASVSAACACGDKPYNYSTNGNIQQYCCPDDNGGGQLVTDADVDKCSKIKKTITTTPSSTGPTNLDYCKPGITTQNCKCGTEILIANAGYCCGTVDKVATVKNGYDDGCKCPMDMAYAFSENGKNVCVYYENNFYRAKFYSEFLMVYKGNIYYYRDAATSKWVYSDDNSYSTHQTELDNAMNKLRGSSQTSSSGTNLPANSIT